MRLCIAGLFLDVSVDASVAQALPNLLPFVVPECDGQVVVTRILTGQYISSEESSPTFVSQSDEKLIRVWLKPDECKLSITIPRSGQTFWLQADRQWQSVQTDWISASNDTHPCLNDFIMIAFVYRSAFYHTVTIHASAVAIQEQGCAFIGPSGIGKSTHSRLWLQHIPGARLLNDDQPVLRLHSDGTVKLYGSPWSGKTPCYHNEGVRLKALFIMQQAMENRLTRLSGIETFQQLLKATSLMGRDTVTFQAISRTQARICELIPAYWFRNCPTQEAATLSHQVFLENSLS